MSDIKHRTVETNGIHMYFAESGAGPLVVLCHGWLAQRMKARVRARPVDHTPIVTAPCVVVDIIREAIAAVVLG